jgi:hypothetical protein
VKKKIIIIIFFTLAIINTIIAGFWILGIGRKTDLLSQRIENAIKLDSSLYDSTSLKLAILSLEEEVSKAGALKRKGEEYNPLKMTEEVLLLFEKNGIRVISYRLEGEENREELVLTGEGPPGSVLKLIYELSFSKSSFRFNFVSIDARFPGEPAILVIRITYV